MILKKVSKFVLEALVMCGLSALLGSAALSSGIIL